MACYVFGNPITTETLVAMPEYEGKTITRRDRAQVALNLKNAQDKDEKAQEYVEKLKEEIIYKGVTTHCLIYNATGDTMNYVGQQNWHGQSGSGPYPIQIENGQCAVFLHVNTSEDETGSVGAIVYRGNNNDGIPCDWMTSWSNPQDKSDNKVYTEIRWEGHYFESGIWNDVLKLLNNSGPYSPDMWNGCVSNMTIGSDNNEPKLEGIYTLA